MEALVGAYYVNGGVGHAAAVIQALGAWPTLRPPAAASTASSAAAIAITSSPSSASVSSSLASASATSSAASEQPAGDHLQPRTTMMVVPGVIEEVAPTPNSTLATSPSQPTGQFLAAATVATTAVAATTTSVAATATPVAATASAAVHVSLTGSGKAGAVQGSLTGSEKTCSINANATDVVEGIERLIGAHQYPGS